MSDELEFRDRGIPRGDAFTNDEIGKWLEETENILATIPTAETLEDRAQTVDWLKQQIMTLFYDPNIRFNHSGIVPIKRTHDDSEDGWQSDWQTLQQYALKGYIKVEPEGSLRFYDILSEPVNRAIIIASTLERLPLVEASAASARERIAKFFDEERARFGNKFANLHAVEIMADELNGLFDHEVYTVPPYLGVPVEIFDKYSKGESIDKDLREFMPWIEQNSGDGYWVRSSATVAEDADSTTAAGIYKSVFVSDGSGMEGLIEAVNEVYGSVNSANAIRYREQHGITQPERMGLILHANVDTRTQSSNGWGYTNSVVPGRPELQEVYWFAAHRIGSDRPMTRMPLWKESMEVSLARPLFPHYGGGLIAWDRQLNASKAPYFPIDRRRAHEQAFMTGGYLSYFAEKVYGRPVQTEFAITNRRVHPLQVRPLPESFLQLGESFRGFPDHNHLYSGRALGIANGVKGRPFDGEKLIREYKYTGLPEGDWVAVFESNWTMSALSPDMLKSVKAVIVVEEFDDERRAMGAAGSHIETICAENGIPCSFATDVDAVGDACDSRYVLRELIGRDQVVMYMDGLESRVY